ncbi:MAG: citrate synthase [Bacteriovoracaceae bacterium]|nr:citrate synthase [Bacteriovoracaceae bacterium]
MSELATLNLLGKTYELPVMVGTENEKAIDITKLRAQTGYITMDSGYMNTGACTSSITYLDGEEGILRYRGIPIEELSEKSNFMEVSYLLLNGKLPTLNELNLFTQKINQSAQIPEGLYSLLEKYPKHSHPMGLLSAMLVSLCSFYPEHIVLNMQKTPELMLQMIGQMSVLSAAIYRMKSGLPFIKPLADLSYTENFLQMMYGKNPNPVIAKALDVLLILHADHEQNCSTSTVRLVGSSQANLFASLSAGVTALWGPLHGGANQAVLEMLEAIEKDGGDYKKYLNKAKDKNDSFKLMGFGHRVYKNFDPRAKVIKKQCDLVLSTLKINDPLLEVAKGLEQEALKDSYFVERNLYPNVDFYSGIIFKALGIPTEMFTVMFALGRLPGWMAQWKEMNLSTQTKIGRPRQIYVGEVNVSYTDIKNR